MNNWVSADDKLPEEGKTVLLKYYNGYAVGYYYDDNFYLDFKHVDDCIVYGVTHWMHIPTAPKE